MPMSRALSYTDAVRLLGGGESRIVAALDQVTGGLLLGAAASAPALIALLDAKTEVVRLGNELITSLFERRAGLHRYDRTRRLPAAHTVVVVTAYFEALAAAELPFRFRDLELTATEQLAAAEGRLGCGPVDADLMRFP